MGRGPQRVSVIITKIYYDNFQFFATLILGDLSIQGNIKPIPSLNEPLQIGMDKGEKRACIPIENKRHFLDVPADIVEKVDPIFYGEPMMAAQKRQAYYEKQEGVVMEVKKGKTISFKSGT